MHTLTSHHIHCNISDKLGSKAAFLLQMLWQFDNCVLDIICAYHITSLIYVFFFFFFFFFPFCFLFWVLKKQVSYLFLCF